MALPLYFRLTVSCIDGALVDYELHAWSHEGHGVVWELRRILDGVLGADHGHKLHEWLKPPRGQRFRGIFQLCGLEWNVELTPSRQALQARLRLDRGNAAEILKDRPVHAEYTLSTRGVCLFLLACSSLLGLKIQKRAAVEVLRSFCRRMLPADILEQVDVGASDQARGLCRMGSVGLDLCCHLLDTSNIVETSSTEFPQVRVAEYLCAVFAETGHCHAARRVIEETISKLGQIVDVFAATASFTSDPRKAACLDYGMGRKRRRVDEDFKKMAVEACVGKTGTTSRSILRHGDELHVSAGARWEVNDLLERQSANWLMFEGARSVSVIMDGSRVGSPASELEVAFAWNQDAASGAWLPPQVV
jgi:hypothetical protein